MMWLFQLVYKICRAGLGSLEEASVCLEKHSTLWGRTLGPTQYTAAAWWAEDTQGQRLGLRGRWNVQADYLTGDNYKRWSRNLPKGLLHLRFSFILPSKVKSKPHTSCSHPLLWHTGSYYVPAVYCLWFQNWEGSKACVSSNTVHTHPPFLFHQVCPVPYFTFFSLNNTFLDPLNKYWVPVTDI